ncbi:MAG: hypothetical protein HOO86_17260, partial [Bacteroidales bacterium]|nr:hypothetical protein [Bacteroidales bacterium]
MKDFLKEGLPDKPGDILEAEEPPSSTAHTCINLSDDVTQIDEPAEFLISEKVQLFIDKHFPRLNPLTWNSWQWQISHSYTQMKQLN